MKKTEHRNKPDKQIVAANIRRLRRSAGLTLQELADAIGVTKGTIHHYENCDHMPSDYNLKKLAKHFHVSPNELTNPENLSTAEKIRLGRRNKSLTQSELARLINADQSLVAIWETGGHEPKPETKTLLNQILDIDL